MHTISVAAMNLLLTTTITAAPAAPDRVILSNADRARLVAILVDAADDEANDVQFVGIHAAEALVAIGRPELVVETFRRREESPQPGYRVCVWRVLARAETHDDDRRRNVERIRRVLLDSAAPDRPHALEALAKLAAPIRDADERRVVREVAASAADSAAPFALWRLAQADERTAAINRLLTLSKADDHATRLRALYVLARLRPLPKAMHQSLLDALTLEPDDSEFRPALICVVGGLEVARLAKSTRSATDRYRAAMELAEETGDDTAPLLWSLVDDDDVDVRVAAAFAILRRSMPHPRY